MNERPMTELRRLLDAADPVRDEPELPEDAAARMRAAMLAAAPGERPSRVFPRVLALAAAIILMVAAGILAGRRMSTPEPVPAAAAVPPESGDPAERRQLQFATPGGTRIIWTLDPQFTLEGTLP